jgi:hypothetical protein
MNSRTVWNRAAGAFSSARWMARRIASGARIPSASDSIGMGCCVMCCVAHSNAVFALKGSFPVSIS